MINSTINNLRSSLHASVASLKQAAPAQRIDRSALALQALSQRLHTAINSVLQIRQQQLAVACRSLDTTSPLATLERGYAIVTRQRDGHVLQQATSVEPGEQVTARLAQGRLLCTVDECLETEQRDKQD